MYYHICDRDSFESLQCFNTEDEAWKYAVQSFKFENKKGFAVLISNNEYLINPSHLRCNRRYNLIRKADTVLTINKITFCNEPCETHNSAHDLNHKHTTETVVIELVSKVLNVQRKRI